MKLTILLFLFTICSNLLYSQDKIEIDKFEFEFGESSDIFLKKYSEFSIDEYIDEEFPNDVTQYYYTYPNIEVSVTVKFFKNKLVFVKFDDEFMEGVISHFNPTEFGFIKTGEEKEYFDEMYPNATIEIYTKDNFKLYYRNNRFGFLLIEKLNIN